MQFELSFEDGKSEHFGDGFERNASSRTGRYTVLVLIATLAAILLWLIGAAAGAGAARAAAHPSPYTSHILAQAPGSAAAVAGAVQDGRRRPGRCH
ncbi:MULTISPECIES: hypothetical protein [unclassified Thiocapsa]|uniref:hypothetical protein n=1 Tax=unclassified Thiocapsa TaxID=2641286 RepID=UPI0035AD9025